MTKARADRNGVIFFLPADDTTSASASFLLDREQSVMLPYVYVQLPPLECFAFIVINVLW
jgi:hypothetical protein